MLEKEIRILEDFSKRYISEDYKVEVDEKEGFVHLFTEEFTLYVLTKGEEIDNDGYRQVLNKVIVNVMFSGTEEILCALRLLLKLKYEYVDCYITIDSETDAMSVEQALIALANTIQDIAIN